MCTLPPMKCRQCDAQVGQIISPVMSQAVSGPDHFPPLPAKAVQLPSPLPADALKAGRRATLLHGSPSPQEADEAVTKLAKPRERATDQKKGREASQKGRVDEEGPRWKMKKKFKPKKRKNSEPSPNAASNLNPEQADGRPKLKKQPFRFARTPPECSQPESKDTIPQPPARSLEGQAKALEGQTLAQNNAFERLQQTSRCDIDEYPSSLPEWLKMEFTCIHEEKLVISPKRLMPGSSIANEQKILFPLLEDLHCRSRGKIFTMSTGLHIGR